MGRAPAGNKGSKAAPARPEQPPMFQSFWSAEEDKCLERALAQCEDSFPLSHFQRIASMLPAKSVDECRRRFEQLEEDIKHIEAGHLPLPVYSDSPLDVSPEDSGRGGSPEAQRPPTSPQGATNRKGASGKASARAADPGFVSQERRKGVPWTEEEHRLFLLGLNKFGKGDWRSISRNFVVSRTPTQVASHAQKYFIRLNSMSKKDKRRTSIHDITRTNGHSSGSGGAAEGSGPGGHAMGYGGGMQQGGMSGGYGGGGNRNAQSMLQRH